ncbi:calmodulin-lysine N-methyltransferase-like [Argonauta hians]
MTTTTTTTTKTTITAVAATSSEVVTLASEPPLLLRSHNVHSSGKNKTKEIPSQNHGMLNGAVAMQRWQILAKALNGKKSNSLSLSPVSSRRFNSLGLLRHQPVTNGGTPVENDITWHEYVCNVASQEITINIRLLPKEVTFDSIFGFNNTGNVCIWPSEEVLAYYCLKHHTMFSGKKICELGGGMTCLAGICVAACSDASYVEVTDGNENSIKNVYQIVKNNEKRNIFGATVVCARSLRWNNELESLENKEKFDYILCADCLFFEEARLDLIDTIKYLLKPGGEALVFAPTRKNSFNEFLQLASSIFHCSVEERYDDDVWNRHLELESHNGSVYNKDLHYPVMMILRKPADNTSNH